jgi:hypothetical protein
VRGGVVIARSSGFVAWLAVALLAWRCPALLAVALFAAGAHALDLRRCVLDAAGGAP